MADYLSIIEENIKHGKSQSYFNEIRHPEIFNIIEQKRLRHEMRNLAQEACQCNIKLLIVVKPDW